MFRRRRHLRKFPFAVIAFGRHGCKSDQVCVCVCVCVWRISPGLNNTTVNMSAVCLNERARKSSSTFLPDRNPDLHVNKFGFIECRSCGFAVFFGK